MFIGDGSKLVRDAFALDKKHTAIDFNDEMDAIGTRRFDSEKMRTGLTSLTQLSSDMEGWTGRLNSQP